MNGSPKRQQGPATGPRSRFGLPFLRAFRGNSRRFGRGLCMDLDAAAAAFREFAAVIRALRTPGTGCPWDLEQDHRSLQPYLVEEAYEVLEAIDRADDAALR